MRSWAELLICLECLPEKKWNQFAPVGIQGNLDISVMQESKVFSPSLQVIYQERMRIPMPQETLKLEHILTSPISLCFHWLAFTIFFPRHTVSPSSAGSKDDLLLGTTLCLLLEKNKLQYLQCFPHQNKLYTCFVSFNIHKTLPEMYLIL